MNACNEQNIPKPDESQIEFQFRRMEANLQKLQFVTVEIQKRLEPVLGPKSTSENTATSITELDYSLTDGLSPVAARLERKANDVAHAAAIFQKLLNRIAL